MKNIIKIIFLFELFLFQVTFAQESKIIGKKPGKINFTLLDGTKPTWEDFKGQVVLIDFWATWCTPCINSFPHINELVEKFKDEPVQFISLTYEPKELADKFFEKYELNSEIAIDNDFATFRALNGWAVPNVFMVNKRGKIVGRVHPEHLTEEAINQILAGKIPDLKQTKEDAFDPKGAEEYFRSMIEPQMKKFGITN